MSGWFKLIRGKAILFAVFVMYCMRYFVLRPILGVNGLELQLPEQAFTLVVMSVCFLIAAAGAINDYFDTRIDRIASVKDVLVGRSIPRRVAIMLHSILNLAAVVIAFALSAWVGMWKMGILFLLVSGLLWFYSSSYKRYTLVGNLFVGLFAALIPFVGLVFEMPLLTEKYAVLLVQTDTDFLYLFRWMGGFSLFLFLNGIVYEMNKDIYTIRGDQEKGIRSVPVRWGVGVTKRIIVSGAVVAIAYALWLTYTVFSISTPVKVYVLAAVCLPYLVYIAAVLRSERRAWQLFLIRLVMVTGVAFSFLIPSFLTQLFQS